MSAPSLVKRNPFCFCLLHHAYSAMAVHSLFILCLYWKASHILSSLSHNKTLVHPSISSHLRLFQIMLFLHHRFCPHTRFTTTLCHSVPKCEDMPWHDIIKSGPAVHLRILFAFMSPSDGWFPFSSDVRLFVHVHSRGALLIQAWRWGHEAGLNPISFHLPNRGGRWVFYWCVCVCVMDRLRVRPHCIARSCECRATVLWTCPFGSLPLQIIVTSWIHTHLKSGEEEIKPRKKSKQRNKWTYSNYHLFFFIII